MLNLVVLMGRLTGDPELKKTSNDVSFTRFSIAVQRNYVSKNVGERETDFFSVVAWRSTAEYICKYFKKGDFIVIQGSIQTGSYEKDGVKKPTFDIIASNVGLNMKKEEQDTKHSSPNDDVTESFIF